MIDKMLLIAILLCAGYSGWFSVTLNKENASLHWSTVSGTISQSDRVIFPTGGDIGSRYIADVAYTYKINGTRYVSHQISLWSRDLRESDDLNAEFVSRHPVGSAVEVYYDPKNPANAVLIPGADKRDLPTIVGGGILFIFVVVVLLGRIRKRWRQSACAHV